MQICRVRRLGIVLIAIAISALLFHVQLAYVLLDRGDAYMSSSNLRSAQILYARAAWFDRWSLVVAERRSFAAYLSGDIPAMEAAVNDDQALLAVNPDAHDLLVDEALCAMKLHRDREAAWAYERAGTLLQNPQYLVLAGWAQVRLHRLHAAGLLWNAALMLAPRYQPALFALQSHHLKPATVRL